MVSTYLVHHGYWDTAEAFASSTGQVFEEDYNSIKNRQSKYPASTVILLVDRYFCKQPENLKKIILFIAQQRMLEFHDFFLKKNVKEHFGQNSRFSSLK